MRTGWTLLLRHLDLNIFRVIIPTCDPRTANPDSSGAQSMAGVRKRGRMSHVLASPFLWRLLKAAARVGRERQELVSCTPPRYATPATQSRTPQIREEGQA